MRYVNSRGILKPFRIAELFLPFRLGTSIINVTNDIELQTQQDIDLVDCVGNTYSVKWQPAVAKYGNLAFEIELRSPTTGESRPGNFLLCKANRYLQVWPIDSDRVRVALFDTSRLHELLKKSSWKVRPLQLNTEHTANADRKFSQATNKLVPVNEVLVTSLTAWDVDTSSLFKSQEWKAFVDSNTTEGDYYDR